MVLDKSRLMELRLAGVDSLATAVSAAGEGVIAGVIAGAMSGARAVVSLATWPTC